MNKNKKITIHDVASETGLSIATISRVINNKGGYSKKTEELVNEAIDRLSFVPNLTAKTLASNKSRIIGLVLSFDDINTTASTNYLIQFLQGVLYVTTLRKYNLLLESNSDELLGSKGFIRPQLYEGIIFSHLFQNNLDNIHSLIESDFPVVYAGPKLSIDSVGHHVYAGYIEYKREALELLYKKGHRKIIVLESYYQQMQNPNVRFLDDVIQTFRNEKNLPYDACKMIVYDGTMPNHLQKLLTDVLSSGSLPDAIFADSEASVSFVYNMLSQLGISIPDDISVISTVHVENAGNMFHPPLSTVFINAIEMGKRAAELLIHFIEKEERAVPHEVMFEIIERESIKDHSN